MKRFTFFVAACAMIMLHHSAARAQAGAGLVSTVAGCYACIVTPVDAVTATLAEVNVSAGIGLDAARNVYIADKGFNKVRILYSATNLVYTAAGNGTAGFSGDGGAATLAKLNRPSGIFIDGSNNLYIADEGNSRVRKVTAGTGIITTIAGGGVSVADGVAATTASINPKCVYVDAAGNIYTGGGNKIRKINGTTGIITTIAGNGSAVDAGDGGAATSAGIAGPVRCITADGAGNIYFISNAGNSVRKINAVTGIVTSVVTGLCAAGGFYSCGIDIAGNVIIADRTNGIIRKVDPATNNVYTIAGGGFSAADWVPALTAYMNDYLLYMDNAGGNIYYTDSQDELQPEFLLQIGRIRQISSDSLNHPVTHVSHRRRVGPIAKIFEKSRHPLCAGSRIPRRQRRIPQFHGKADRVELNPIARFRPVGFRK